MAASEAASKEYTVEGEAEAHGEAHATSRTKISDVSHQSDKSCKYG